jgi:hypothetical protein
MLVAACWSLELVVVQLSEVHMVLLVLSVIKREQIASLYVGLPLLMYDCILHRGLV